jgi:UDP-N-acetyl-D-glucosamine dehydrogenase
MGYVGLPLAVAFDGAGIRVLGFDVDPAKAEALNVGQSYIKHIAPERVAALRVGIIKTVDKSSPCDASGHEPDVGDEEPGDSAFERLLPVFCESA